ncbi:RNA-directed DNA polymerase [Streptomyces sp. SP17KL33]|uniref:RNA-directed DNA polymerase n=1 Tax=Streptomyces sp. SP17KL33 TaxID=3002534 RepID=UPI002E76C41A|nr:RNA-directed DNA polymerase [Streptomyces sp. SP17KL33]MEE1837449.1 RNA-directed DNA polymerase [Streptomyces sp. SP17KL33]
MAYEDVHHQWDRGYREMLEEAILAGDCGPTQAEIVDYPKSDISVRPIARFSARDRIIYDALVFGIAGDVDRQIHRSVHSYRWHHSEGVPIFWFGPWKRMRRLALKTLRADSNLRMASVDVSAFYEHIDVDILADDLACMTGSAEITLSLQGFLKRFQNVNHAWGLPQGPDSSGILANLYLSPIDGFLDRNKLRFLRYSDDMMIFHRDWTVLRDVVVEVNSLLRSRRLAISSHKTRIRDPEGAIRHVHDVRRASLQHSVDIGLPEANHSVRKYFDEITKSSVIDGGSVRFTINRLAKLRDDYAVGWCLDNLVFLLHSVKEVFSYLGAAKSRSLEIQRHLVRFMESSESSSYPFIEQRILRYFLSLHIKSERMKEAAWKILEDRNREDFSREFASRYIGKYASVVDAQLLRHRFEEEPAITMRRALLCAMYESGNLSSRYISEVEASFPQLEWVCAFLRSDPLVPAP